jgi:putative transposon-encoded protein
MPEKVKIKPKTLAVDPEYIEVKTVTASGNGAVIPYTKKHVGKEVYVILKEKCKTK